MSTPGFSTRRPAWHSALLVLALLGPAAHAAEAGPASEGVQNWLSEHGLVRTTEGAPFVLSLRERATDMVVSAMNYVGVPYRFGGNTAEEGFDCSGFTRYVYEQGLGLALPRRADEQATSQGLEKIDSSALKPGDLVFFNTMRRAFSHVGIYVGDHRFIHAPRRGAVVRLEDMRARYWTQRFNGARRPAEQAMEPAAAAPPIERLAGPLDSTP